MSDLRTVVDGAERERALDCKSSFIVQAPAGSGKTELLIQRYLALLSRVEAPEEIVAITFTIKAAGEMRERILAALAAASSGEVPKHDHQRRTWELARAARSRDVELGWGITGSPNRLRIQTIDALCARLTRQMPVLSGFGAQSETLKNAAALYIDAARRTLGQLDEGGEWASLIGRVLIHLDNNIDAAEQLLVAMLTRRDQWLRHVADPKSRSRETMEAALADLIMDSLVALRELCPSNLEAELTALARYAARNLAQPEKLSEIAALEWLENWPGALPDDLPAWRGLAKLLLTDKGMVRKRANAQIGFPAPRGVKDKSARARLRDYRIRIDGLLANLAGHQKLITALHLTRLLPPPAYTDAQWGVVGALTGLLPLAVAQLELLFRERGQVDFTAVSQAAVRALGSEDEPTDLALALDYRIRHLLVDEFQDTSQSQYELLTRLTAGWQPDDGRTLFLVGDPMQSVYRFREAEIGLYLRTRREGIGGLKLELLTLRTNFRSQAGLVEWVNQTFRELLPEEDDLGRGAVPFSRSQAANPAFPGRAVTMYPLLSRDRHLEARLVTGLVQAARAQDPAQRIAILVRSRGHLAAIVPALKQAGLRFQAIDIEQLGDRPIVQDCHALTRALLHPADRIAWLSVLRAPWCGLTLSDLDALAGHDSVACLWDLIDSPTALDRLSADGRARLTHLHARLRPCFAQRRREPLRRWIEGAWLALGGPAAAKDAADLDDAQVFFGLLEELEVGGDLPDLATLAENVSRLYALPDPEADDTLQVMTIHKAKGLEFDTVILPGLGYAPRQKEPRLLLWLERPRSQGRADLLLAPIRERSESADPIYRYLDLLDDAKAECEDGRMLYVAATRAKSRLHLIGDAVVNNGAAQARPRSLLARLWPVVEPEFQAEAARAIAPVSVKTLPTMPVESAILRFPAGWSPAMPEAGTLRVAAWPESNASLEGVEFSWASETARHIGTVVHRWLQIIAEEGVGRWAPGRISMAREVLARNLRGLGVPEAELGSALTRVGEALGSALGDTRARWLLSAHREARSELRLTGILDGKVVNVAIDRTFIDDNGVRWLVDYKTGIHGGADLEGFLDNERERYRVQLERYAELLSRIESRPIRLALYFPLLKGWREWGR